MFSATFPSTIQKLASEFLRTSYVWIGIGRVGSTLDSIKQRIVEATADKKDKMELLLQALKRRESSGRTLVFVAKKSTASWVCKVLTREMAVNALAIHGDRTQSQRESALAAFRAGDTKVIAESPIDTWQCTAQGPGSAITAGQRAEQGRAQQSRFAGPQAYPAG